MLKLFWTIFVLCIQCLSLTTTSFIDYYKEDLFADIVCLSSATKFAGLYFGLNMCALKCVRTKGCLSFFYDSTDLECYSVNKVLTSRSGCESKTGASYYIRQADVDCYTYTQEDTNRITSQQSVSQKSNCESYQFHVYTGGKNDAYRGCGACYCCKWKGCRSGSSRNYNGTWSQTLYGRQCQRWDSQTPHVHDRTVASSFPEDSVYDAHNYCRDPDYEGSPWCYTQDLYVRWEFCFIPKC